MGPGDTCDCHVFCLVTFFYWLSVGEQRRGSFQSEQWRVRGFVSPFSSWIPPGVSGVVREALLMCKLGNYTKTGFQSAIGFSPDVKTDTGRFSFVTLSSNVLGETYQERHALSGHDVPVRFCVAFLSRVVTEKKLYFRRFCVCDI